MAYFDQKLRKKTEDAELAFEVGKLYWYYYDYGKTESADNQITRMKSSIQWFEDAVDYGSETDSFHTMAVVYRDIGKFNRDITLDIEEASDKGKYAPYWENIKELVNTVADESDESEIIQLEVYKLAMYSIESYARKFKADGVDRADMEAVFTAVKSAAEAMPTTSDKTGRIKQSVLQRCASAGAAIENAYREKVETG